MSRLIENLRGKSETSRHGIALGVSFAVTLIIALVWVSVVFLNAPPSNNVTLAEKAKIELGPFATFGRNLAQPIAALKIQWQTVANYLKETKYQADAGLQVISTDEKRTEMEKQQTDIDSVNSAVNKANNLVY